MNNKFIGHEKILHYEQEKWLSLLYRGDGNYYGIYQMKETTETKNLMFSSWDTLVSQGITITKGAYFLVYAEEPGINEGLEDLYIKFNLYHPKDFKGHSLSVSDVVVLNKNGELTAYYLDRFRFLALPGFFSDTVEKEPV